MLAGMSWGPPLESWVLKYAHDLWLQKKKPQTTAQVLLLGRDFSSPLKVTQTALRLSKI